MKTGIKQASRFKFFVSGVEHEFGLTMMRIVLELAYDASIEW